MTWGPYAGQQNNRETNNFVVRERGYITVDAREQTAYGTARAYIEVGLSTGNRRVGRRGKAHSARTAPSYSGRVGPPVLTQSFYDFYCVAAAAYRAAFMPIEDTGDGGQWVWGYTAQLGKRHFGDNIGRRPSRHQILASVVT